MVGGDDNDFKQDHLSSLGVKDADWDLRGDEGKQWKELFGLLEKKFKQRELDVFYRYFGLNGYKREKSKDIAKSLGMSEGNIRNSIINKMIKFLQQDKRAADVLSGIQDIYNESLMVELVGLDRDQILEVLCNDDMFILLEELNKWNNKNVFNRAVQNALFKLDDTDVKKIEEILKGDFESIDHKYKQNKQLFLYFLGYIYPTENMSNKTDVSILNYMSELQELYKKYNLK